MSALCFTNVRIVYRPKGGGLVDDGAWYVLPGDTKKMEYIKMLLLESRRADPKGAYAIQARGESVDWHDVNPEDLRA